MATASAMNSNSPASTSTVDHSPAAGGDIYGMLLNGKYRLLKLLNAGSAGLVYQAVDVTTGTVVAIKFVEHNPSRDKQFLREILNHRLCVVHPHIVQFIEVFLAERYVAIVMEFVSGGDMCEFFKRNKQRFGNGMPENTARWFFQQLVTGLEFCHRKGIANRDIKLDNVLIDHTPPLPILKICDFGYSKHEDFDSRPKSLSGTPDYLAPEVLMSTAYNGKSADVWSCGVILYTFVTGRFPFFREGDGNMSSALRLQQIYPRILAADFVVPANISPELKDLMSRMLVVDPSKRATLREVMEHPWFKGNLPDTMDSINDVLVRMPLPQGLQSEEQIMRVLADSSKLYYERYAAFGEAMPMQQ